MPRQKRLVWTSGETVKRASHEFRNVYIKDIMR